MRIPKECQIEKVANKKDHREALNYVWVDTQSQHLFAANGAALACVPFTLEEGDVDGPLLPEEVSYARKHRNGQIRPVDICQKEGVVSFDFQRIKNNAEFEAAPVISLDAKKLYDLAKALGSDKISLTLSTENARLSVIKVEPAGPNLNATYGYLMPVK